MVLNYTLLVIMVLLMSDMHMEFKVSYVICERNHYAYKLVILALIHMEQYKWFPCIYLEYFFFIIGQICLCFVKFIFFIIGFVLSPMFCFHFFLTFLIKFSHNDYGWDVKIVEMSKLSDT